MPRPSDGQDPYLRGRYWRASAGLGGGDRNAISGLLKKAVGSRNVRMASLEAVKQTTGYEVGSLPPFHWQPEGFRSFLDEALMSEEVVGVGAGQWGEEIVLSPANLQRACNGRVVNLTERRDAAG
ncbi:MAG: YbaK/EbsC family protein [Gemmatimonadales bacterium]